MLDAALPAGADASLVKTEPDHGGICCPEMSFSPDARVTKGLLAQDRTPTCHLSVVVPCQKVCTQT